MHISYFSLIVLLYAYYVVAYCFMYVIKIIIILKQEIIYSKIPKFSHITDILKDLHWLPIRQRITFKILLLTYQAYHNTAPDYLCELITPYCSARNLRSNDMMLVRPCHPGPRLKTYGEKCFQFAGPKEWNNLPLPIRESPSIYIFKSRLKTYLFNCAFN